MALAAPRNKLLTIRLSEHEYRRFHEICIRDGARSMSERARSALLDLVAGRRPDAGDAGEAQLREMIGVLDNLDQDVRNCMRAIQGAVALLPVRGSQSQ